MLPPLLDSSHLPTWYVCCHAPKHQGNISLATVRDLDRDDTINRAELNRKSFLFLYVQEEMSDRTEL